MKTQSFRFICLCTILISLISGCEKDEHTRIEGSLFSLELWSDWRFEEEQGFDTYVGKFTDGKNEILYDYGYFAGVNLDAIQQTPETTYYEETIIDGAPAKIVEVNNNGIRTLILYIHKDEGNSGKIWIVDPGQDNLFVTVFKSFRFL